MAQISSAQLEDFINNQLKEDLKQLDHHIKLYNEEIMEFVQLKNTLQTLHDNLPGGYRTQMNIGANIFMEAKVKAGEMILVDVGKGCFVEFSLEEALKFAEFKIKVLTKECDVLRSESIRKRTEIKLALLCMGEQQRLHAPEKD